MDISNLAQWIIVAIAVGGLIFNTGIIYNHIKHLQNDVREIKEEVKAINAYLLQKK